MPTINTTTLVKSVFAHHRAEKALTSPENFAINHFGKSSAVAQVIAAKGFTNPSQEDYANIAAIQQFISLVKERSLIGKIEELGKNLFMPLNTALGSFDLSPCKVVEQKEPTEILTETSDTDFILNFKKIGGYAIFPERYFKSDYFSKIEPLINSALLKSYVAGENADFIETITTGAKQVTATGLTMALLLADIESAISSIDEAEDAIILVNPKTALKIANELELDSLGVSGGSIRGIPVITSKSVALTSKIVFDASKLILASDPTIEVKLTKESTVVDMTGKSVYLFQENKVAIKVMGLNGYKFANGYTATVIEG